MTTIAIDITEFRNTFTPQFNDTSIYPDSKITDGWAEVGYYMSLNTGGCGALSDDGTKKRLGYLLLAHILVMGEQMNNSSQAGQRLASATQGLFVSGRTRIRPN